MICKEEKFQYNGNIFYVIYEKIFTSLLRIYCDHFFSSFGAEERFYFTCYSDYCGKWIFNGLNEEGGESWIHYYYTIATHNKNYERPTDTSKELQYSVDNPQNETTFNVGEDLKTQDTNKTLDISTTPLPEGISFNKNTHTLTIATNTKPGKYNLQYEMCETSPTTLNTIEFTQHTAGVSAY